MSSEISGDGITHLTLQKKVVLERAHLICDADLLTGIIRVQNLAYEKHIVIRFTFNDWESFSDVKANWEESVWENGHHWPETDRFRFSIKLPATSWSLCVRFAISYDVAGQNYWDNNLSSNYELTAEKTWRQCMWSAVRLVRGRVASTNVHT